MKCQNKFFEAGGWRGILCSREATTEYNGQQFCKVCATAKQRGRARSEASWKRRVAEANADAALRDQNTRKLAAFDDLLKAAEAVTGIVRSVAWANDASEMNMTLANNFHAAITKAKEAAK